MVTIPLGGVGRQLSGRHGEDEPTPARIDRGELQHVPEEGADPSASLVKTVA